MTDPVVIGDCRLYCGDALQVLASLPEQSIDFVITDPPYGISLEVHSHNRNKWGKDWSCEGDCDQRLGNSICGWAFERRLPLVAFASPGLPWAGRWDQHLVWDKGPAVGGGGNKDTHWKKTWELIQVANTRHLNGKRDPAVLRFWVSPNFRHDFQHHMCQKPTALLRYLVGKVSQPGDLILDPFMGSGSTLVAAMQTGRRAIGIECDPHYFAVACRRLRECNGDTGLFAQAAAPDLFGGRR